MLYLIYILILFYVVMIASRIKLVYQRLSMQPTTPLVLQKRMRILSMRFYPPHESDTMYIWCSHNVLYSIPVVVTYLFLCIHQHIFMNDSPYTLCILTNYNVLPKIETLFLLDIFYREEDDSSSLNS